jgi:hypothetical protein
MQPFRKAWMTDTIWYTSDHILIINCEYEMQVSYPFQKDWRNYDEDYFCDLKYLDTLARSKEDVFFGVNALHNMQNHSWPSWFQRAKKNTW